SEAARRPRPGRGRRRAPPQGLRIPAGSLPLRRYHRGRPAQRRRARGWRGRGRFERLAPRAASSYLVVLFSMRTRSGVPPARVAVVAAALIFAFAGDAASEPSSDGGPASTAGGAKAAVVARVGSKTITAGELEAKLATVPSFQLTSFGADP